MIFICLLLSFAFCETEECPEGQGIDYSSGDCVFCPDGEGILEDGKCGTCASFQGVNIQTGRCGSCAIDECIDQKGRCVIPPEGITIDPTNKKCKCPNLQGFLDGVCSTCQENDCVDPNTKKIINGYDRYFGRDQETGECVQCQAGECIHPGTRACIPYPEGSTIDSKKVCNCPTRFGIDPESNKCVECTGNEYVLSSYQCGVCPKGYSVSNGNCAPCDSQFQGVDPDTLECRFVYSNEGRNPYTGFIMKCPEGSSSFNKICKCYNGNDNQPRCLNSNLECVPINVEEGIVLDDDTYQCTTCKENQEISNDRCRDCNDDEIFNTISKKCESKNSKPEYCLVHGTHSAYVNIPPNTAKNEYGYCKCQDNNLFLDPDTLECRNKQPYEGTSYDAFIVKCSWEKCIDEDSKCRNPSNFEVINQTTHDCQLCDDKQGIDPVTKQCTQCK